MPVALGINQKSKLQALADLSERFECKHEDCAVRARTISGGSTQYCYQCLRCGSRVGTAISRASVQGHPPPFNEGLLEHWKSQERIARERLEDKYKASFWDDYSTYLRSPEWVKKRQLVMRRSDGVCEGCMEAEAVHVHHLTYEHVGNELLFELVALCETCHHVCHEHLGGEHT